MKKYVLITLILTVVTTLLFVNSFSKSYKAVKLEDSQGVPKKVLDTLQQTPLERGIYYFAETYTNESAYLVFCGGEELINGYDININKLEYNYLVQTASHPIKSLYGFYKVDYTEKESSKLINYGFKVDYPIVIYRIEGKVGVQAWPVLPLNSELKIIKWWGANEQVIESRMVKCELSILKEDKIEPRLSKMFIEDSDREQIINISRDDGFYYLYKVNSIKPYSINIESVADSMTYNSNYPFDIIIHKQKSDTPYYTDVDSYYYMIKVTPNNERVYPRNHLLIGDNLEWKLN